MTRPALMARKANDANGEVFENRDFMTALLLSLGVCGPGTQCRRLQARCHRGFLLISIGYRMRAQTSAVSHDSRVWLSATLCSITRPAALSLASYAAGTR